MRACDVIAERGSAFETHSTLIGQLLEAAVQPVQARPSDAMTRLLRGPGTVMETPGASPGALLLSTGSHPGRKRAAGEAGAATRKQRVLDEEEYIEVRPRCGRQRLLGPSSSPRLRPELLLSTSSSQVVALWSPHRGGAAGVLALGVWAVRKSDKHNAGRCRCGGGTSSVLRGGGRRFCLHVVGLGKRGFLFKPQ